MSPKPGLKLFREDYKSVEETCEAVGFVRDNCRKDTRRGTSLQNRRMVAFDARLNRRVNNLGKNGRVVFGNVDLNEGLGYNASTGIFTTPSGGVYVFDWTTLTWGGLSAYTSLVVNDKLKSWNHCHDSTSKIWLPCSKMTAVKLNQGDKVWVGVFMGKANIYGTYSSFSGYKL
uniref:Uncharacterized protein n=1 Tax=Magallana gigas TaxID=29159 RepID=K1RWF3_MAGGI